MPGAHPTNAPHTVPPRPVPAPRTVLRPPVPAPRTVSPRPASAPRTVLRPPVSPPRTVSPRPASAPRTTSPPRTIARGLRAAPPHVIRGRAHRVASPNLRVIAGRPAVAGRAGPRRAQSCVLARAARGESGQAAVEFVAVLP